MTQFDDIKPGTLRDRGTDRLAREVAARTGETQTDAIRKALAERQRRSKARGLAARLEALGRECAALPDIDTRSPDEIVGYDETGMWR